jgi:isochorismate synthase
MSLETNQLPIYLLLKKDLPFAVFRLPGSNEIQTVIQAKREIESISFEGLDKAEGFAVAEFNSFKTRKIFLIKPDWKTEKGYLPEEIIKRILALPDANRFFNENTEVSEEQYLNMAKDLIQELKEKKLKKIVLSRMVAAGTGKNFTAENFYQLLETSYRDAFVYLFNLPGKGTWAGASPEVLLQVNDKIARTVSLAGTKPIEKVEWTAKEIEEQKLVTDSIALSLKNCGIKNFTQKGPETLAAGNIAHLKTAFQFPASELKGKTGKLLKELHPTPAVCGLPKEIAFDLISKIEKHERRFYTGFLGPLNQNGNTNLFVNLRCAELGKDKMNIYVGGGLTASSLAGNEWEETVRKSRTLLGVAEKLQTFAS